MKTRAGFTLIELMIVVLIVAVLAAVLVPFMRARVEAAKWSEGKAGAGTIASALRAYAAEQGSDGFPPINPLPTVKTLFKDSDLRGKYFTIDQYILSGVSYDEADEEFPLKYTITVNRPETNWKVSSYTLDHTGKWTEIQ